METVLSQMVTGTGYRGVLALNGSVPYDLQGLFLLHDFMSQRSANYGLEAKAGLF